MARQKFGVKIDGTLDDITFYRAGGQNLVKQKSSISADRIATDPNFKRTRENNSEFAYASYEAKELLDVVKMKGGDFLDSRCFSRLQQVMRYSINKDAVNVRGERQVQRDLFDQDLIGFRFNDKVAVGSVMVANVDWVDDIAGTGKLTLNVSATDLSTSIRAPQGATHASIHAIAAYKATDGSTTYTEQDGVETIQFIELASPTAVPAYSKEFTFSPAPASSVVIGLVGVCFWQEVNGKKYPLNNKGFMPLEISYVSITA